MSRRIVLDLSHLPLHASGTASPTWWGTCAFMLIEGSGFSLAIAVYFYLMSIAPQWPIDAAPPDLLPGTMVTATLVASAIPNAYLSRWANRKDLRLVQIGLIVMCAMGVLPLGIRVFEFAALHILWDDNAYGSITWTILGLHTTHIITDLADTIVLTFLMFSRHADSERRYGDVQDNCLYWNFVIATWIPIYACIYWMPRQ